MKVQIEVGKGIQCDGIEIMFGDSISSVVKAVPGSFLQVQSAL